jgi:hypothetical protein
LRHALSRVLSDHAAKLPVFILEKICGIAKLENVAMAQNQDVIMINHSDQSVSYGENHKQDGNLGYHRHVCVKSVKSEALDIDTVQFNTAVLSLQQAKERLDKCTLSRTSATHDSHASAAGDTKGGLFQGER